MEKNEDIVTVSWQNGHYEVYDHKNNKTYTKMTYRGAFVDFDAYDACRIVDDIMENDEYERTKAKEKHNG